MGCRMPASSNSLQPGPFSPPSFFWQAPPLLTCQTVADMIKGRTPEEIRKTFYIKNDFTPEEEAEIRKENQWAFE